LLLNYYKKRIEKFNNKKEKSVANDINNVNNIKTIIQTQSANKEMLNTVSNVIKTPIKKKSVKSLRSSKNSKIELQNLSNSINNMNYTFDNILRPPNPSNLFNNEIENILDDLIEPSTKIKNMGINLNTNLTSSAKNIINK
jgi:hypothetical protein